MNEATELPDRARKLRERIRSRTEHITMLARVVAAEQGEPIDGAPVVTFDGNNCKLSQWVTWECCGVYDEWGEAQWHAFRKSERPIVGYFCPRCLPAEIERGEVIRDDWAALETLAYMLGGSVAADEFVSYFELVGWA